MHGVSVFSLLQGTTLATLSLTLQEHLADNSGKDNVCQLFTLEFATSWAALVAISWEQRMSSLYLPMGSTILSADSTICVALQPSALR